MIRYELLDHLLNRLAEYGIRPVDGEVGKWVEGRLNTFKGGFDGTRRATSYLLYRVIDGGRGIFGYFGDFHASFGDAVTFFFHENENEKDVKPSAEQIRRRNELLEKAREESQAEMRSKREEAARLARAIIESGHDLPGYHAYLIKKQIGVPLGAVAIDQQDAKRILGYSPKRGDEHLTGELIVIPLYDAAGQVVNVEMIDGNGRKCSIYGGQRGGAYWLSQNPSDGDVIGLAEGMATAQTITESAAIPVASVGGCGNFDAVIAALKTRFPRSSLIVFSDRGNGEKLARKAAERHGAAFAVPPQDIEGTDYNDLLVERGGESLAEAIDPVIELVRRQADPDGLAGAAKYYFSPRSALVKPEIDWVLPGLMAGSLGLLVGQGSVGKSFLAMQAALSIAFGESLPWSADPEDRVRPGKVGLILGEDDLVVIQSRYHSILNAIPAYRDECYLSLMDRNLRVYGMPGADMRIMEEVRGELVDGPFFERLYRFAQGKRLIFIDPLGKLLDGNENDNRIATRMMERLVLIGCETGCAIIVLHHSSKSGSGDREEWTASRGAGAITTTARWQANMRLFNEQECAEYGVDKEARHEHVVLSVTKINNGSRPKPALLRRNEDGVLLPFTPAVPHGVSSYEAQFSPIRPGVKMRIRTDD